MEWQQKKDEVTGLVPHCQIYVQKEKTPKIGLFLQVFCCCLLLVCFVGFFFNLFLFFLATI